MVHTIFAIWSWHLLYNHNMSQVARYRCILNTGSQALSKGAGSFINRICVIMCEVQSLSLHTVCIRGGTSLYRIRQSASWQAVTRRCPTDSAINSMVSSAIKDYTSPYQDMFLYSVQVAGRQHACRPIATNNQKRFAKSQTFKTFESL